MFSIPPLRFWLPNLFTLASTFCGILIIWLSATATSSHEYYLAALLIPTAFVFDGFDGRVARWVHGQSEFGVQLDSLSDLVSFGVAPGILLYFWALDQLGIWGLVLAFAYTAGAMLRLARFNVQAAQDGGLSRYFRGLPAPSAGMGVATLVCLDVQILQRDALPRESLPGVVVATVLLALLMISNVPFRTFKDLRRSPKTITFVGGILVLVGLVTVRYGVLAALSMVFCGYFFSSLIAALLSRGWRQMRTGAVAFEEDFEGDEDDQDPIDRIDRF